MRTVATSSEVETRSRRLLHAAAAAGTLTGAPAMRLALALAVLVAVTLSQEQLSKPRAPGNRRRKLMKLHKAGNTTKGKYCVCATPR
jgi:hypothetical protein